MIGPIKDEQDKMAIAALAGNDNFKRVIRLIEDEMTNAAVRASTMAEDVQVRQAQGAYQFADGLLKRINEVTKPKTQHRKPGSSIA